MQLSRQAKVTIGATAAAVAIVLISAYAFELSLERAVLLAPVLVIGFGVVAGLCIFWAKVALMHIRGDDTLPGRPRKQRPGSSS